NHKIRRRLALCRRIPHRCGSFAPRRRSGDQHMQRITPIRSMLAVVVAAAVVLPASAQDWKDLITGAPQGANELGLIDVTFLREQAQNTASTTEILDTLNGVLSDHVTRGAFVAELNLDSM